MNESVTAILRSIQSTLGNIDKLPSLSKSGPSQTDLNHETAIRHKQAQLIHLFSKLLYIKIFNESTTIPAENFDSAIILELWFSTTSVDVEKLNILKEEICDVLDLLQFSQTDLRSLCDRCGFSREEKCRFTQATLSLRHYTKAWLESNLEPVGQFSDDDLSWHNCESLPENLDLVSSAELPSDLQRTGSQGCFFGGNAQNNLSLPMVVHHNPCDEQQPSSSTKTIGDRPKPPSLHSTFGPSVHPNDRRSLSVSESGMDSGASDSGVGSNMSQNSLPTTTPPPSPGYFSTKVAAHHPHSVSSVFATAAGHSKTLPAALRSGVGTTPTVIFDPFNKRRKNHKNTGSSTVARLGVTPPASPSYLQVSSKAPIASSAQTPSDTPSQSNASGSGAQASPYASEMMRSRSHESNLQARVSRLQYVVANCPPPRTAPPVVEGTLLFSAPVFSSSLSLSNAPNFATTTRPYAKKTDIPVGSTPNMTGRQPAVRKSATFGADETPPLQNLNPASGRLAGGGATPRKSSQPQPIHQQQQLQSPVEFNKLAAVSPRSFSGTIAASNDALSVPPVSPSLIIGRLGHQIKHRFTKMWKPSMDSCYRCNKSIGISGERCQDCKIKVHSSCKEFLDDACGFGADHRRRIYDFMLSTYNRKSPSSETTSISPSTLMSYSQSMTGSNYGPWMTPYLNQVGGSGAESASSSSCNSSAPSTPAFGYAVKSAGAAAVSPGSAVGGGGGAKAASASYAYLNPSRIKFTFPEPGSQPEVPFIHVDESELNDPICAAVTTTTNSTSSGDVSTLYGSRDGSDNRLSPDVTVASSNPLSINVTNNSEPQSQQHQYADSLGSNDSNQSLTGGHQWQRNKWTMSTIRGASSSWREWTILYEDLKFPEGSLLGKGRFGDVHRAYWHQDVAVKLLNMDHVEDSRRLEAFKNEVSTFRHTRHENLVLFLGCCMIPPRLGIVMNLCKGQTLYTHVHLRRDRFDMNKIISIAIQLCQGMSYLHGKKIVHKDLRTKNIFVEGNSKVVITDFSLFSVRRLCQTNFQKNSEIKGLYVPERWLCYLAPELAHLLKTWTSADQIDEFPFNEMTDVYSFGSVWYELLTYEFPYKKLPSDSMLWHVCKGIKPGLTNMLVAKEIKDVLIQCWAFKPEDRPIFHQILKTFEKLPRKRLERSPSQPVHLSRSAESIF